ARPAFHNRDVINFHRTIRAVVRIAAHPGDLLYQRNGGVIALAEDGVMAISMSPCWPVNAVSVMKNCEPLVSGPAFAYARRPGRSNFKSGETSFLNAIPISPLPLPAGSPP